MTTYTDNTALRASITRLMTDGKERTREQIALDLDTTAARIRYTLQRMVAEGALRCTYAYGHTQARFRAAPPPIVIP